MKHKVKSILLEGGEGKPSWYGRTFDTAEQFDIYIRCVVRPTSPDFLGCYKTDVVITFDDGQTYKARYDVYPIWKGYVTLAEHVRRHNEFYSGEHRPSHLTEAQYTQLMQLTGKETQERCKRFLADYEIL